MGQGRGAKPHPVFFGSWGRAKILVVQPGAVLELKTTKTKTGNPRLKRGSENLRLNRAGRKTSSCVFRKLGPSKNTGCATGRGSGTENNENEDRQSSAQRGSENLRLSRAATARAWPTPQKKR